MSEATHSPLPWYVDEEGDRAIVRSEKDLTIVAVRHRLPPGEHEQNMQLIVRAVNSHADLLAALRKGLKAIEDAIELGEISDQAYGIVTAHRCMEAAIAKAEPTPAPSQGEKP